MEYYSSRNDDRRYTASEAVVRGLAPDGGLFMPATLPRVGEDFIRALCAEPYPARSARIMGLFLPEYTAAELAAMTEAAYGLSFNARGLTAPLHRADEKTAYLELHHGPTCAFKDVALQLMPRLLVSALRKTGEERSVCILVATSGDTGKAALEGFRDVPGTRIQVFYPQNGVSDVQELQMCTQTGGNVSVCAVQGNFDDAQRGVKAIFSDKMLAEKLSEKGWLLSSANSINWGRLLPQIVYYFSAYCDLLNAGAVKMGQKLHFCVPTGNFGDILAGWYARELGLPVGRLLCASNDNRVLTDFFRTGVYDRNRPFHQTTSPSMDILVSSNLERLLSHTAGPERVRAWMDELNATGRFDVGGEVRRTLSQTFTADWCGVADAGAEIDRVWREEKYLIDPHTAVAGAVLRRYRQQSGDDTPAVVVSTASPFKFCGAVLTALGQGADAAGTALMERLSALTGAEIPAPLAGLDARPRRFAGCVAALDMKNAVEAFLQ